MRTFRSGSASRPWDQPCCTGDSRSSGKRRTTFATLRGLPSRREPTVAPIREYRSRLKKRAAIADRTRVRGDNVHANSATVAWPRERKAMTLRIEDYALI